MNLRIALAALAALAASGCAAPTIQGPPPPDAPGNFRPLTTPFIALGDTQEHESTGFPLLDNDSAVDAWVEVAQRPPEAPLFSRRILEWVVERHPHEPLIHLGDVLDMSCRSELKRMVKLGLAMRQPGALLPGNHDGLLFGIFNLDAADITGNVDARRWNLGCRSPIRDGVATLEDARGQAVTKRDFIAEYLALVAAKMPPGSGLVAPTGAGPRRLSWRNPDDDDGFFQGIEARIDDGRFYSASYIAQMFQLPAAPGAKRRVRIVALDTNQLITIVGTLDALRRTSPGDIGRVGGDQLDAIAPWIDEAAKSGDLVVFAGHHNWDHLSPASRLRIGGLMARLAHPLVYLSAHTHRGYWASHRVEGRPLLELNVSSLSDWPIAYRRVHFEEDPATGRVKVVADLMPRDGAPVASDEDLLGAWGRLACRPSGVPGRSLAAEEIASVRAQRASRGRMWEWLVARFGDECESCGRILFDHAHAYQDQLLSTIEEMARDLGSDRAGLAGLEIPPYCEGRDFSACSAHLRSRPPAPAFADHVRAFREKARLVDRANEHLDDLRDQRAKEYMACRAVLGAKIDFDETPEEATPGRAESVRRAAHFFRTEATVGPR